MFWSLNKIFSRTLLRAQSILIRFNDLNNETSFREYFTWKRLWISKNQVFLLPMKWHFDEIFGYFNQVLQENWWKFTFDRISYSDHYRIVLASKVQRLNVKRVQILLILLFDLPDLLSKKVKVGHFEVSKMLIFWAWNFTVFS